MLKLAGRVVGGNAAPDDSAYFAAIQTYVGSRLTDQTLSAPTTAAAVGISARHLSRVMAAADTRFPAYVLERRLALAKTLLERAEDATASVAEIAARCGLTSATTFSTIGRATV